MAHAKKLASTVVGQVQRDIKEMELATIPTELSFQLEQNPKVS